MKYGVQLFSLRKYLKDEKGYEQVFKRVKETGAQVVQLSGGNPSHPNISGRFRTSTTCRSA